MKKLLGRLFLAAIVIAVLSFFVAPAVAFFAIRSAAQANDVGGLSRLIDFDAVRTSLRPQLSGRPEGLTPPPSFMQDPIGAFRRQFEDAVAAPGPDPDAYLTPDAIDGLLRGEGRSAATRPGTPNDAGPAPWPGPAFLGDQFGPAGGDGRRRVGDDLHLRAQGAVPMEAGPYRPAGRGPAGSAPDRARDPEIAAGNRPTPPAFDLTETP